MGGGQLAYNQIQIEGDNSWLFMDVILDTSKRDTDGTVTTNRITCYKEIAMANATFMVIPAPEGERPYTPSGTMFQQWD